MILIDRWGNQIEIMKIVADGTNEASASARLIGRRGAGDAQTSGPIMW